MASITHTPVTITDHEPVELGAEKAGIYSVTIFANELSRDGVSVDIDGMDFSNYRKNPVVLFAHDYSGKTGSSGLPIGRTLRLGCTRDGRIKADFEFLSGDPFADRVRNAWNRGFLRGASIGWRAIEARPSERGRGLRIVKSELIEWSIVAVPADPDALRSAYTRVMRALIEPAPASGMSANERLASCDDTGDVCVGAGFKPAPTPAPDVDLAETRSLLETLSRTVRADSTHPEFCRDPPGEMNARACTDPHTSGFRPSPE